MPSAAARPGLRYRLDQLIGQGATAEVWRATDTTDGSRVCVKRLHGQLSADAGARARLAGELAAARRLDIDGLVPLLDADLDAAQPYLVFAALEGETLAGRLARSGRLEPWQAVRMGAQVARTLAAVHDAGLVHRDVKPGNILLGNDGRARLIDFGICSRIGTSAELSAAAGPGMTMGTLPYLAPEQLAGQPAQPPDDVFALGAVLYQALTGQPPYEADSAGELARAHRRSLARPEGVPATLAGLVMSALQIEALARPSAALLAGRLRGWLSGQLDGDAPTALLPATRAAGTLRSRSSVLAAGLLTGLALAVATALGLAPPPPEAGSPKLPALGQPGDLFSPSSVPAARVELRVPAEPALANDSRPVAQVSTGDQPGPAARPDRAKPAANGRAGDDRPKVKSGKGEGKGKATGEGKGKGKDKGKGKGKGKANGEGKHKGKGKGKGR